MSGSGTGTKATSASVSYALTTAAAVKSQMGSIPAKPAFWLYCSASDATAATVASSPTGLTLIITGGAAAGTNTLLFASYATMTLLVAAINALTGWEAGLLISGSADSADLQQTGTLSCLGTANQQTLLADDNYTLTCLINAATDIIERWANRRLKSRTYNREVYQSQENRRLILDNYPVTQLGRISIGRINCFDLQNTSGKNFANFRVTPTQLQLNADGTVTSLTLSSYSTINDLITAISAVSGWSATLTNTSKGSLYTTYLSLDGTTRVPELVQTDYQYCLYPIYGNAQIPQTELMGAYFSNEPSSADTERNYGILHYPAGFNAGWNWSVFVDYTAGFSTVPAALEQLCIELTKMKYQRIGKDSNIKSESIGGVYSYSLGDFKEISASLLEEAAYFRRLAL